MDLMRGDVSIRGGKPVAVRFPPACGRSGDISARAGIRCRRSGISARGPRYANGDAIRLRRNLVFFGQQLTTGHARAVPKRPATAALTGGGNGAIRPSAGVKSGSGEDPPGVPSVVISGWKTPGLSRATQQVATSASGSAGCEQLLCTAITGEAGRDPGGQHRYGQSGHCGVPDHDTV